MTELSSADYKRNDYLILSLIVALGVLLRLHFLYAAKFTIDSDEAIVGLMANHILQSWIVPTFYYGQHYMGSLEPVSAAVAFAMFGSNNIVLRLVPLVWFVVLLVLFYRWCWENAGRHAARIATFFLAISPAAFIEWSTKARGGFIEIMVLAVFSMLFTFRFLREGKLKNAYLSAFILGVGWWTNNQIIYFFPATAVVMLAAWKNHFQCKFIALIKLFFICTLFFILGGAPYWIYNIYFDWASLGMFQFASSNILSKQFKGVFSTSLPMILGGKRFWTYGDIYPLSTTLAFSLYGMAMLLSSLIVFKKNQLQATRHLIISSFLTLFCTVLIFTVSQYGSLYSAPRYLLPLYLSVFPLVGVVGGIFIKAKIFRLCFVATFALCNFASAYAVEMAVPGEPIIYDNARVSRNHGPLIKFLNQRNISYIRTNYWIGYRLAFETDEKIKFKMFQQPREARIRSYEQIAPTLKDYIELPIVAVSTQAPIIRRALKVFGASFKETVKSGYWVFYNIKMHEEFLLTPISPEKFSVTASLNNETTGRMFDKNLKTRWASGRPQDPSMNVTIKFNEPTEVRYISLETGMYKSDSPRALEIYNVREDGQRQLMMNQVDTRSISFFLDTEFGTGLLLKASKFSTLMISQVGKDSFFDWSIAELEIYE